MVGFRRAVLAAAADTFAAGIFAVLRTAGRAARDLFLYGVPVDVLVRAAGTLVEPVVGRPYGLFRDLLIRKFGVTKETSAWRKALLDVAANGTFYVPLSAAILCTGGACLDQILLSCGLSLATSVVLGRPYGWFMERVRHRLGVGPA